MEAMPIRQAGGDPARRPRLPSRPVTPGVRRAGGQASGPRRRQPFHNLQDPAWLPGQLLRAPQPPCRPGAAKQQEAQAGRDRE